MANCTCDDGDDATDEDAEEDEERRRKRKWAEWNAAENRKWEAAKEAAARPQPPSPLRAKVESRQVAARLAEYVDSDKATCCTASLVSASLTA